MSRSYHVTVKEIAKHSKSEIDEMAKDPKSKLNDLAKKSGTKKQILKSRKEDKQKLKLLIVTYHLEVIITSKQFSNRILIYINSLNNIY